MPVTEVESKKEAIAYAGFSEVIAAFKPSSIHTSHEERAKEADPLWEEGYVFCQVKQSITGERSPLTHACKPMYVKFAEPILTRLKEVFKEWGTKSRSVSLYISAELDRGPVLGGIMASFGRNRVTLFRTARASKEKQSEMYAMVPEEALEPDGTPARFLDRKWCKFFREVGALGKYRFGLHLAEQYDLCTVWENIEDFHNRTIEEDEARNHPEARPFRRFFANKLHLFQDCIEAHNAQVDCETKLNPDFAKRESRFNPTPGEMYAGSDPVLKNVSKMTLEGDRLELPQDEMFKNYARVKEVLLTAGFKYKKSGFESPKAKELLQRLLGGEKVNDKKKFQFFATCETEADEMRKLSGYKPGMKIGETSAGHGDLVDPYPKEDVTVYELFEDNIKILKEKGYNPREGDFLEVVPEELFDIILMNPPFTKGQDMKHILHSYKFLKPKGRMVSIASTSWGKGSQKAQKDFRRWLAEVGAEVTQIEAGAFKESGTSVATTMILINKEQTNE